jgi:hypothetical protein
VSKDVTATYSVKEGKFTEGYRFAVVTECRKPRIIECLERGNQLNRNNSFLIFRTKEQQRIGSHSNRLSRLSSPCARVGIAFVTGAWCALISPCRNRGAPMECEVKILIPLVHSTHLAVSCQSRCSMNNHKKMP